MDLRDHERLGKPSRKQIFSQSVQHRSRRVSLHLLRDDPPTRKRHHWFLGRTTPRTPKKLQKIRSDPPFSHGDGTKVQSKKPQRKRQKATDPVFGFCRNLHQQPKAPVGQKSRLLGPLLRCRTNLSSRKNRPLAEQRPQGR